MNNLSYKIFKRLNGKCLKVIVKLKLLISFRNKCWISAFLINTEENMYLLLLIWPFPYFLCQTSYSDWTGLKFIESLFTLSAMTLTSIGEHLQKEWKLWKHKTGGSSSLGSFRCYLGPIWVVGNVGLMLLLSFRNFIFDNLLFLSSGEKSFLVIFVSPGGLRIYKQVKDSQGKFMWL